MRLLGFSVRNNFWPGKRMSPQAQAIFAAMSPTPDNTQQWYINQLVTSLWDAGVWQRLDVLYLLAAPAAQWSLINWVAPGTNNAALVNNPTFATNKGYTTNGLSNYLTTYNPTSGIAKIRQDDAHMSVWCLINQQSSAEACGQANLGGGITLTVRDGGNTQVQRVNNFLTDASAAVITDGRGLVAGNRTTSLAVQGFKNGVQVITNNNRASTSMIDAAIRIGSLNDLSYSSNQFCYFAAGQSLTPAQNLALYNAVLAYLTYIGAFS